MSNRRTAYLNEAERAKHDLRFREAAAAMPLTPHWQGRAACRDHDPEKFFPSDGIDLGPIKRICLGCPVMGACLADALETREIAEGIRGAADPEERRAMLVAWRRLSAEEIAEARAPSDADWVDIVTCPAGHPLGDGDRTKAGRRFCRICATERAKRLAKRRRDVQAAALGTWLAAAP